MIAYKCACYKIYPLNVGKIKIKPTVDDDVSCFCKVSFFSFVEKSSNGYFQFFSPYLYCCTKFIQRFKSKQTSKQEKREGFCSVGRIKISRYKTRIMEDIFDANDPEIKGDILQIIIEV